MNVNVKPCRRKKSANLEENPIMLTRTGQSIRGFGVCTESEKMNLRFISVDNKGKLAIFGTSYNLRGLESRQRSMCLLPAISDFRLFHFQFSVFGCV